MFYFHKDIIKSMKRRLVEVRLLAVITMLSVMFITTSLIFQVNSERYLFEVNRLSYGDWVIAETIEDIDKYKQVFTCHSYFEEWGTAVCGLEVVDGASNSVLAEIGYIDDNLAEIGHVKLKEGRMPIGQGEIVAVSSVLVSLGYSLELGQKITLYVKGNAGEPVVKEYELVGVLDNSMSNWCVSGDMPSVIISKAEADTFNYKAKFRYFYKLKEEYKDIDTKEFYDNLVGNNSVSEDGMWSVSYNHYLYSTSFWGEPKLYIWVECMLLLSGMAALSFCMITYIQSRKKYYYCLRVIGMSKMQMKLVILMENVAVCLPVGAVTMFTTMLLWLVVSTLLAVIKGIDYFYYVPMDIFIKILGSWILVVFVSVVMAIILTSQKRLYDNTRSVTIRGFTRRFLNKVKSERIYSSIYKREQRVYLMRYVVSIVISFVITNLLLYSGSKMWEAWMEYKTLSNIRSDFECRKHAESGVVSVGNYVWYIDTEHGREVADTMKYSYGGRKCTDGIGEEFFEKLDEISNIKSYYASTLDNSHLFEWDNMMEDSYIKDALNEYNGVAGWRDKEGNMVEDYHYWHEVIDGNTLHFEYNSWFVWDVKDKYEYYSKICENSTMTYDGFASGEQVFAILNRESDYLTEGSDIRILAGDDVITVQIGAIIPVDKMKSGEYPGNCVDTYGRNMLGINIIASDALAEKIAKAEGGQVQYNLVDIDLSVLARYGITIKQCAKLISDEGMFCTDWTEGQRKIFDDMFTEVVMYGLFGMILMMFYVMLKNNIVKSGIITSGNRIKRLRMLGMSKMQVVKMYVAQGLSESKWLIMTLPAIYVMHLYLIYDKFKGNHLRMYPERFYVEELRQYVTHVKDIMYYTIDEHVNGAISIALIILIVCVNVLARYIVVNRYLKQENWVDGE